MSKQPVCERVEADSSSEVGKHEAFLGSGINRFQRCRRIYQPKFYWGFSSSQVILLQSWQAFSKVSGSMEITLRCWGAARSRRQSTRRKIQPPWEGKSTGVWPWAYQLVAVCSEIQPVSAGVIIGKDSLFQNLFFSKNCSGFFFPPKFHNGISDRNLVLISLYKPCHLVARKSLFLRYLKKINAVRSASEVLHFPALLRPSEQMEVSCSLQPSEADVAWCY